MSLILILQHLKEWAFRTIYCNNLDAFWDCLTGYIHLPMTIE
ncbi:barstar family protein [Clostridium estertheticum]|nr:barstar family protein [Clostridium estertheticum]